MWGGMTLQEKRKPQFLSHPPHSGAPSFQPYLVSHSRPLTNASFLPKFRKHTWKLENNGSGPHKCSTALDTCSKRGSCVRKERWQGPSLGVV